MAEAFTRRALSERGPSVRVSSSGLLPAGNPAADEAIDLMAARGLDMTEHRSRVLDAEVLQNADLVLVMERRHLTEIVAIDPEAYRRSFTLPEFVRCLEALESDPETRRGLAATLDAIDATRTRRDVLRVTIDEEIVDPMGRSSRVFNRVADEIAELVDQMVAGLWPLADPAPVGRL